VLLVDLKEDPRLFAAYAQANVAESITALMDVTGATAARWAPPGAQPSFTDRAQVMFDTTLVIDDQGVIRLFLIPDSAHFDPTFRAVREEIERLLTAAGRPEPPTIAAEQVVSVEAFPPGPVARGADTSIAIDLDIARGYHLMADRASRENYVGTQLEFAGRDGLAPGVVKYPASTPFHFDGRSIATFRGRTRVVVPLHVEAHAAPGVRTLSGSVRYQACTASRCLMPTTKAVNVRLAIAP
jgi:hypothetical protein